MKKIISILLSFSFLCNTAFTHGVAKLSNESTDQKKPYKYIIAGVGVAAISIPTLYFLIRAFSGTAKSLDSKADSNSNFQSWKDVSHWYYLAAEEEKKHWGETSEYFECLADSFRCLSKLDNISEAEREHWRLQASEYFKKSYESYDKTSNEYANDIGSYKYQINSAKAAEMLAKSEECLVTSKTSAEKRKACAQLWGKLEGKKPSYDAYARAKKAEYSLYDYRSIANFWEAVKNDRELKASFSENSWNAYFAYAEANRQEWLFKCNESSRETVYQSWMKAYEKDKICSANCFIYNAFAAEAYQKAQDALKM